MLVGRECEGGAFPRKAASLTFFKYTPVPHTVPAVRQSLLLRLAMYGLPLL